MLSLWSAVLLPSVHRRKLIDALVKKGSGNLTVISCDAGKAGLGVGKLIRNGQVKKLIASHVGLNSEVSHRTPEQPEIYNVEYTLVPQGNSCRMHQSGRLRARRSTDACWAGHNCS